jgi:nuclease-like protein
MTASMGEDLKLEAGTAGASSRREYERRKAKRESETRERHPHIGGLLLKIQEAPRHETAWATGATGEEALAVLLDRRCPEVFALHDRRMPRSRANIDHLAVGPSGVYVIDAKQYRGKIEVRRPFFGDAELWIAGRRKPKLVESLTRQVSAVRLVLDAVAPGTPVHGCFCFLNPDGQLGGSGLPLLRTLRIQGYPLLYPRRLAKILNQTGELRQEETPSITAALAQRFPSA